MVANGNRKADSLVLLRRRELALSLAPVDLLAPRRPLKWRSAVVSLDRSHVISKRACLDLLSSCTPSSLSVQTCIQPILISIYILYLKLLCEYLVALSWTTNTIVPDLGGGPDLLLSGFLPWIFVVSNHTACGILL